MTLQYNGTARLPITPGGEISEQLHSQGGAGAISPADVKNGGKMDSLIAALQIFLKYGNPSRPTTCEHDELIMAGYAKVSISSEDTIKLNDLGFFYSDNYECFFSYRYGSC